MATQPAAAPKVKVNTVSLKHLAASLAADHDMPKKQAETILGDLVNLVTSTDTAIESLSTLPWRLAARFAPRRLDQLPPELLEHVPEELGPLRVGASGTFAGGGLPLRADVFMNAEWEGPLDPPFCAGHWVLEMIAAAGGTDALAGPGERSREVSWAEISAARPDVVVVMPCGLHADEAEREASRHAGSIAALGATAAFAVDAAASFSRPGPRLADGVELLGSLLHPTLVPPPSGSVLGQS